MGDTWNWILTHWEDLIVAINALLAAAIGISLLIPGDQPEKFLKSVVEFISKFSKKPSE